MKIRAIPIWLVCLAGGVQPAFARDTPPPAPVVWITAEQIRALPANGPAWETLAKNLGRDINHPNLADQDDNTDVYVLARAYIAVREGDGREIAAVRKSILTAIGTEEHDGADPGRTLALGRNLPGYIIGASLVGFENDGDETRFRDWLAAVRHRKLGGRTLISTHEERPNNWGLHAGTARVLAAAYLGDGADLERAARVLRGWLGDREAWAGFKFGVDLSWQADSSAPVGVNPLDSRLDGQLVDGLQPEEMRRGGPRALPLPAEPTTGYAWEALQGAFAQAEALYRAGYSEVYQWEDRALHRAAAALYRAGWPAEGDDDWLPHLINARCATRYCADPRSGAGKSIGWTAWTHGSIADPPAG